MIQRYNKANFADFLKSHNGWVVGAFFPPDSAQHSSEVEIRHGVIKGNEFVFKSHYHTQRTSYILVVKGEVVMKFDGALTTISEGQFVVFAPGVTEEGISAKPGTELLIVRTPSSTKEDKVEVRT
ncbi:cupin domain-containing protein [Candidatus Woesebacteria bacterium]|nr:cupin domain-containing protein [Candidatus Woesebacteria bacterium]